MMSRLRVRTLLALSCAFLAHLVFPGSAISQELRPNLKALPPSNVSVVLNSTTGYPELRFGVTSWNNGDGPLELVAGQIIGNDKQEVLQRIYVKGGGYNDYPAGAFVYHPAHQHFHLEDYAVYILNPVDAPGASQRQSQKTSFCILDTNKIDTRLPGAPRKAVYTTCNPIVQGMSVGWGDTYGSYLAGQSIDMTGQPDGLYELTITFDPKNHLIEKDDSDNTTCVALQISVTSLTVTTLGACGTSGGGGGTVSISSISPNQVSAGGVVSVTITGSNFTDGIAVGFENGTGPAPVASNPSVASDGKSITATVSVKSGGGRSSSVWDLRVGSAVLPGAFTVVR